MSKRIERLEEKFSAIQAELKRERSKIASENRKRETRQKIIVGGRLMALAKMDERAAEVMKIVMKELSDSERKVFSDDRTGEAGFNGNGENRSGEEKICRSESNFDDSTSQRPSQQSFGNDL